MRKFLFLVLAGLMVSPVGAETQKRTTADKIVVGSGANTDKAIIFNKGSGSTNPAFKYDSTKGKISFSNDGVVYKDIGSGSGGDGKNYIESGDGSSITGWVGYSDAAGTKPVDGTGGSVSGLTFTSETTSPLQGEAEFQLAKDAANRQGMGWSYDFSIDEAQQGKRLQAKIVYQLLSGTFKVATSNLDPSDLTIWFYDRCSNALIEPSSFGFYSDSSSFSDTMSTTWDAAYNCKDYRLILHVGTTSASAWTLRMAGISVGPQKAINAVIDERQIFSVRVAANGTVDVDGEIGGNWIQGNCSNTTTPSCTFTPNFFGGTTPNCWVQSRTNSTNVTMGYNSTLSSSVQISLIQISTQVSVAGDRTYFCERVPGDPKYNAKIGVRLSEPGDTKPVSAKFSNSSATALPNGSYVKISTGWATEYDSHGGWSTDTFRIPVSGVYDISGMVTLNLGAFTNGMLNLVVYKGGVLLGYIAKFSPSVGSGYSASAYATASGQNSFEFKAGDELTFYVRQTQGSGFTLGGAPLETWVSIRQASLKTNSTYQDGNSFLRYTTTAGQSLANSATTIIIFGTKTFDNSGSFNPSTGVFTSKKVQICSVKASVKPGLNGSSGFMGLHIYKNGALYSTLDTRAAVNASTDSSLSGSDDLELITSDTADIRVSNSSGGVRTMQTGSSDNHVSFNCR